MGLFDWFARSASRYPDEIALDFVDRQVTYAELDDMVSRIAARVAELTLPAGSRIALLSSREPSTYAAYLAVLHQGHTVIPVDPRAPRERTLRAVGLSRARAAVGAVESAPPLSVPVLRLDDIGSGDPVPRPARVGVDAESSAYLLFTSGSTGRPKGVPIPHRAISAFLAEVVPQSGLGPGARLSHTFGLTFDVSLYDLFAAWGSGSTLVVPNHQESMLPVTYANQRRLTHWFSAPSHVSYAQLTRTLRPNAMPGLVNSMFIGEQLTAQQAAAWRAAAPNSTVINQYGPTELTVACAAYVVPEDETAWPATSNGTIPIGTVYATSEWLVIDAAGLPAAEGELVVRGPQRFAGYLDPADNAGRFVRVTDGRAEPLRDGEPPRESDYYRTGDRVGLLGGELVHLGRLDRQVKIAGNRVELGEIEAAIRECPGVVDAFVVMTDGGGFRAATAAAYTGEPVTPEDIRAHLQTRLPSPMVPTSYRRLSEVPRNANGKADYRAIAELIAET